MEKTVRFEKNEHLIQRLGGIVHADAVVNVYTSGCDLPPFRYREAEIRAFVKLGLNLFGFARGDPYSFFAFVRGEIEFVRITVAVRCLLSAGLGSVCFGDVRIIIIGASGACCEGGRYNRGEQRCCDLLCDVFHSYSPLFS